MSLPNSQGMSLIDSRGYTNPSPSRNPFVQGLSYQKLTTPTTRSREIKGPMVQPMVTYCSDCPEGYKPGGNTNCCNILAPSECFNSLYYGHYDCQ